HGHRLGPVFAQVHRVQPAVAAQGGAWIALAAGPDQGRCPGPVEQRDPQAHRACMRRQRQELATGWGYGTARCAGYRAVSHVGKRHQRQDLVAGGGAGHARTAGCRATSNASTKLAATPIATVLPMARNTGIEDSASKAKTSNVVMLQTMIACSVRSWSSRASPACSKNSA